MASFYIKNKNLLFVHVPKTGGRALAHKLKKEKIVNETKSGHFRLINFTKWQECDSFCVVRNPYHRMQSFYRHFYHLNIENTKGKSFLEFVKNPPDTFHRKTQTYWISDKNGNVAINHYIRYENYNKDIIPFLVNKGITNVSHIPDFKRSDYRIEAELTDEIKELIYNRYEIDFLNFNYTK